MPCGSSPTASTGCCRPELGVLVITHYARLLQYIKPDVIHVLVDGRIVETGGPEVADKLERDGYAAYGVEEEEAVARWLIPS